jgi:hydroxymethylpyrimidine/phosphomethylpyrimidine kinase
MTELNADSRKPIVLCFSGLDSTGGAGIQADIETLLSLGCHCAPVITSLTVQNTSNVQSVQPVEAALLVQQARAVLEDMQVSCVKIGLVNSIETLEVLHTLLTDYPNLPVVVDPVMKAGGGYVFSDDDVRDAYRNLLLPLTTLLTPNLDELQLLAPSADNHAAMAQELIDLGCAHVLLTGTHAPTDAVENSLFGGHENTMLFTWPRLENQYHGSGCTLAAACAAFLAHGGPLVEAVKSAQRFTWEALNKGQRLGFGQLLPNRSFWHKQSLF